MKLSQITPKNVKSFIRGNLNYLFNLLEPFEKQQVALRSALCPECTIAGKCLVCTCDTPNMYYDQGKYCEAGRWHTMMNKQEWDKFISNLQLPVLDENLTDDERAEALVQYIAKQYSMEQQPKFEDFVVKTEDDINDVLPQDEVTGSTVNQIVEENENKPVDQHVSAIELHVVSEVPIVYDFGPIQKNKPVSYTFEVKNILNFPISVSQVRPSCKCTAGTADINKDIEIGEYFKVTLTYDAKAVGNFTKSATVNFSNPNVQPVMLIIKGTVQESDEA